MKGLGMTRNDEIPCRRDLALRLGAIIPRDYWHLQILLGCKRDGLAFVLRDEYGIGLYWLLQLNPLEEKSS